MFIFRFIFLSFMVFLWGCGLTPQKPTNPTTIRESLYQQGAHSQWELRGQEWKSTVVPHDDIVKVALFLPLSGRANNLGRDMENAAKMAILQTNPKNVILKIYDTQSTEEGARGAAYQAKMDSPDIIVGPVFSKHVKAVKEILDKPMISFTTDQDVLGAGTYSLGVLPQNQLDSLMDYAKEKGKKRIGLMLPYTHASQKLLEEAILTGDVTENVFYNSGDLKHIQSMARKISHYDARSQAMESYKKSAGSSVRNRLKHVQTRGAYPYDAIFVSGTESDLEASVSFLRYFEVNPSEVKYLGFSHWDSENKPTLARTRAWVSGLPSHTDEAFKNAYQSRYGAVPDELAIFAYDALALISKISQDGSVSRYEILDPNGYVGASGLFRLKEDGTSEHALEIRELSPTEETRIERPAQNVFKATVVQ
ncbi:MAG: penicillin-binding protein activator [Alphaproteobacteria bacterium]|nr:penicillin-binding protein activator [Alphaproteobacteria bacterium]